MVRQRMRVKLNTQRGLGGDRLFAANFVRQVSVCHGRQMQWRKFTPNNVQTNAIAKQMGLSEYCRYRDYAQNHTLAVVRQRVLQSELQKQVNLSIEAYRRVAPHNTRLSQNNADLFTIRMVEQQRRVATDTIDMQVDLVVMIVGVTTATQFSRRLIDTCACCCVRTSSPQREL